MTEPWFKFRPPNWLGEPRLRMCSLSARGLWIDMMAYAHDASPYGHFLIDGKQPTLENTAALVGRPIKEVRAALAELEANGVFSRRDDGAIYSRRMVRDHDRSEEGRKQVNKRWANNNPNKVPIRSPNRSNGADPNTENLEVRISEANASSVSLPSHFDLEESQEEQACGKFDQFWSIYPNKVGKKAARKKFDIALKSVDFEILMGALRAYVNKTDDRPWCNPETWLNQGRWDDEPAQQQRGGALGALDRIESQLESAADSEAGEGALVSLPARRFG